MYTNNSFDIDNDIFVYSISDTNEPPEDFHEYRVSVKGYEYKLYTRHTLHEPLSGKEKRIITNAILEAMSKQSKEAIKALLLVSLVVAGLLGLIAAYIIFK